MRNFTRPFYPLLRCTWVGGLLSLGLLTAQAQKADSSPVVFHMRTANQIQEANITLDVSDEKLGVVLERIERQSRLVFVYSNDEINTTRRISFTARNKPLNELLRELANSFGFTFEILNDKIILKGAASGTSEDQSLETLPNGSTQAGEARSNGNSSQPVEISLTGQVTNENGEGMPGVSVSVKGTTLGTSTTPDGKYELRLPDAQANGTLVF